MSNISSIASNPAAEQSKTVNSAGFEVQELDRQLGWLAVSPPLATKDLACIEMERLSKLDARHSINRRVYEALIPAPKEIPAWAKYFMWPKAA